MPGLAAAALTVGLAACTAQSGPAQIENHTDGAGVAFAGLLPSTESRVYRRYVFQIHGIDTPDIDWGESLLGQIPNYGYIRTTTAGPVHTYWKPAKLSVPQIVTGQGLKCGKKDYCEFDHFGIYRKDVFDNPTNTDHVTVFTYFWRGDLWHITGPYLQPDIDANSTDNWSPNTRKSLLNELIKGSLIDNGLSDAAGYLSGVGAMEREGIESALCAMFADAIQVDAEQPLAVGKGCLGRLSKYNHLDPKTIEFNFLSHSLGSRMLYDVLSEQSTETKAPRSDDELLARQFLVDRARTMMMAANQLPLLAVSGVTIVPATSPPNAAPQPTGPPAGFLDLRRRGDPGDKAGIRAFSDAKFRELSVVAFQDPDDLLGFKASDALIGDPQPGVRFVDVLHRNTPQWLFLLAWPPDAHDHELEEPNSLHMILCGARADATGNLTPDQCVGERR